MLPFEDKALPLLKRVDDLLSRMTIDEKISFLPSFHPPIERLGLPKFFIGGEGAHGLVERDGGKATVFPQPLGLSMAWDKGLMREIGAAIGDEARVHFQRLERGGLLNLFFPTIDMERDPRWGRNEEAYGEDPLLAGKLAVELIKGAQGDDAHWLKITAEPKHFYANNYEFERTSTNSVIPEKLKNEYYLRVFAYAFEEGRAASVMTAYNRINGDVGMLNPELNSLVKKWNPDMFAVSDGGAFGLAHTEHKAGTYAEVAAAAVKAGLVIEAATEAYKNGLLTESEIDAALRCQLKILFRLGVYGGHEGSPYENVPETALCSEANSALARKASLESVVLLKNDGILPLKAKSIAVVGQLGGENLPDWYSGNPPYEITPLDGIKKAFPESAVTYADACDTVSFYSEKDGAWLRVDENGAVSLDGGEKDRALFRASDWGYDGFGFRDIATGKYLTTTEEGEIRCDAGSFWGWFTRELFFMENGRFKEEKPQGTISSVGVAMKKGVSVYDKPYAPGGAERVNGILSKLEMKVVECGLQKAAKVAEGADAAVAVLGNHPLVGARECIDRFTLDMPGRWASLLEKVAKANPKTILAVIAGYPYAMGAQEKAARAVVFTAHGAQEVGTAVGETLSGGNCPSGKLSMTWYASDAGLPDINDYDIEKNKMTYLYNDDKPVLHPFGFGLSYASFEYGDLTLSPGEDGVKASFNVKNTGQVAGDEVAQIYFARENSHAGPIKRLAGFERVPLAAGETKRVEITVPRKEFELYDEEKGRLVFAGGLCKFLVGASSEDIRLDGSVEVA